MQGKAGSRNAAAACGLTVSALPIKYLGLPLTTKTMSRSDYEPLIAKIRARFLSWTSKALAFAGRLQLINSVIASITNFWCSAFSLPQGCIDEIESMCSAFLWSGSPNISSKSKVAWEEVCKPKDEGGLGIRRIKDVSAVFDLKLIWRLFNNSTSLWVQWVKQTILRGESFWDARVGAVGSWVWKKLLQLRPLAKQFLCMEVRNGKTVGFWTDIWLPIGRLIEVIGERGTQKLGIVRNAEIADVLVNDQWRFRNSRDSSIEQVLAQVKAKPLVLAPNVDDGVKWKRGDVEYGSEFSAYSTWNMVRGQNTKVPWAKLIWFKQGVPRYAFVTWLAVKDRLSTGSRMRTWGVIQGCTFCGEPEESRDHLFFCLPIHIWLMVADCWFLTPTGAIT